MKHERMSIRITDDMMAQALKLGNGNFSEGVRIALAQSMGKADKDITEDLLKLILQRLVDLGDKISCSANLPADLPGK
ncbi:MAG: hypothetical protein ACYDAO_04320 [Thermoplasmataceae archaeon]